MFWASLREGRLRISDEAVSVVGWIFTNSRRATWLAHECFLSNPFEFVTYNGFFNFALWNLIHCQRIDANRQATEPHRLPSPFPTLSVKSGWRRTPKLTYRKQHLADWLYLLFCVCVSVCVCVCVCVCARLFIGTAEYRFNITLYSAPRIDLYSLCQFSSTLPDSQCFVICVQLKIFMCAVSYWQPIEIA